MQDLPRWLDLRLPVARSTAPPQKSFQQTLVRSCEWIGHGRATPGETVVKVFGQQQATPGIRGGSKNDGIPDRKLMVVGEIGCRHHDLERRFYDLKRIMPCQNHLPSISAGSAGLVRKDVEKLPENLNRDDANMLWQAKKQRQKDIPFLCAVDALRVDQNIGVERDLQFSSS